jgi:glycosyltransferase involved in cell wall biosynthesis
VLPVLDEAEALGWVLPRVPPGVRPVVVDNGSTDGSPAVAAALGATVVHEGRRGFGAACWAGLQACEAPVVAFMDADASLDPGHLARVLAPLAAGRADLVLGARRPERRAWPPHARLANRYLAARVSRRYRLAPALHDLGPMRAARRADLLALGLVDRRSGWPLEMVVRAAAAGWRLAEVPVPYHRRRGRSKVTGTVRGTVRAVRDQRAVLARYA